MYLFLSLFISIILIIIISYIYFTRDIKKHIDYTNSPLYIDINIARNTPFNIYIDVRTSFEYRTNGFYAKAINIPLSELYNIQQIIPNKLTSILIYCNSGARAKKAAEQLYNIGYKNVRYITKSYTYLL